MKLIEGWERAWRLISVQLMALAALIQAAWPMVPDDLKAQIPPNYMHTITVVLLVAGIVGRLVKQNGALGGSADSLHDSLGDSPPGDAGNGVK